MEQPLLDEPSLTVVVPIYNEVDALPNFLPGLVEMSQAKGWRIILVDDGSTDSSDQLIARFENRPFVKVIHHKVNRGYGGALKSGISNTITSHIVTIDGDGQHSVSDIEAVFNFAIERDTDLVVGNRGRLKKADPYREFGKRLIRSFTRVLMPIPIHDLNSGFKLYRTKLAQRYIALCPNSMAFSDVITLAFINQRHLVLEYPISVHERQAGKSTIGFHTAFETLIEIINLGMLFNPLRIFLPLSLVCTLVGLCWGIPFILLGHGVSVGSMLAIVTGLLFFILGLIAAQLSAIRINMLEYARPQGKADE
jgi:glycosyltransferase involved in cell wall biosynthesis